VSDFWGQYEQIVEEENKLELRILRIANCRRFSGVLHGLSTGLVKCFVWPCGIVAGNPVCPVCTRERNQRIRDSIEVERLNGSGKLLWALVAESDLKSVAHNLSRYGTRCIKFPQPDDTMAIVFSEYNKLWIDGEPLPEKWDALGQWIETYSRTPAGKHIAPSRSGKQREPWGGTNDKNNGERERWERWYVPASIWEVNETLWAECGEYTGVATEEQFSNAMIKLGGTPVGASRDKQDGDSV